VIAQVFTLVGALASAPSTTGSAHVQSFVGALMANKDAAALDFAAKDLDVGIAGYADAHPEITPDIQSVERTLSGCVAKPIIELPAKGSESYYQVDFDCSKSRKYADVGFSLSIVVKNDLVSDLSLMVGGTPPVVMK